MFNRQLASNFCSYRNLLAGRLKSDAALFASDDWKRLDRVEQREWVQRCYSSMVAILPWNVRADRVPVIPAIHATTQASAWKIVENGFTTLSILDKGFYGCGMYFSTKADYLLPYLINKTSPALVVCAVCPGNIFPVVEHRSDASSLLGAPIRPGYQSHYVLTTSDGNPCRAPLMEGEYYDELVIGQEAQVVPLYIVELDAAVISQLAERLFKKKKIRRSTISGPGSLV